tara:strand:- start:22563 stop:22673 length:111 start_codon:yes stop_codon:yes gene_type:complete
MFTELKVTEASKFLNLDQLIMIVPLDYGKNEFAKII